MKCKKEKNNCASFIINYKKEQVKFKPMMFSKKKMGLKEFAIVALGINPVSIEVIAMYIGKMGYETYNKGVYEVTITKKIRHGICGIIKCNDK